MRLSVLLRCAAVVCAIAMFGMSEAEPIRVQQIQGTSRGFLLVRSAEGKVIGYGDLLQMAHGFRITSRLVLHFRDGSIDDDTTIYTQDGVFRLVSDHHVQKGPFFPKPSDLLVEANGQITSRSLDKDGKEKVEVSHIDLPDDVANGIAGTYLLNVPADTPGFSVGEVAATGKGRLVRLDIAPEGKGTFVDVGMRHTATVFRVKVKLGGVEGVVAPVIGKAPEDTLVWVLEGEAPTLVRQVGQLYVGGPIVSIELSGARFPKVDGAAR